MYAKTTFKLFSRPRSSMFLPNVMFFFLFLLISILSQAQWIRKADALKKRSEVPSVVYKGNLYTFLGFTNSAFDIEPSSEVYDPVTDKWTSLASIPPGKAVTHQGVALIDNSVWHIGGRVGRNPGPLTSEIWIYNIGTNSWAPGPQLKDPATNSPLLWAGGSAALIGRTLHVFGGFIIDACTDNDKYHLTLDVDKWLTTGVATWENKLKPMPLKRCHIGTTVLGGKIYALGGQFGHDCVNADHEFSHVYDPVTDTWTQLTNLPLPRSHTEGGTFTLNGKIYIVGGQQTNSVDCHLVTVFDPLGNNGLGSWSSDSAFNLPRNYEGVSAKVIGNTFIFSHGGLEFSGNPQNQTYARTITLNPVYKFGFSAPCLNLNGQAGEVIKAKSLLYTIDDSKTYSLTSNAPWLTISKNITGTALPTGSDIEVTINTSALAPGNYTGTITATGTGTGPAYPPASFCVNLTITGTSSSVVRLNNGGPTYSATNGNSYSADSYFSKSRIYSINKGDIINTNDDALYYTERYDSAFSYNIPVTNGKYKVVLHFAEIYWGNIAIGGIGSRMFNVDIENNRKLSDYDIIAMANGAMKAIQETFQVAVNDGILDIRFSKGKADLPKVSAIEVLPDSIPNTAPVLATVRNKFITAGDVLTFSATATDQEGNALTYSLLNAPTGATINAATGQFNWVPSTAGTYNLTVKVTDDGYPALSDEEQITITVKAIVDTIRINSGGIAITANRVNWLGCAASTNCSNYVTGGFAYTQRPLPTITGVTYPATQSILQTEWTGGETNGVPAGNIAFSYNIPVPNGTYIIRLHFVELNKNGVGLRKFDVNIEGGPVELSNFDIFLEAGGMNKAITRDFPVTVTDNNVSIDFIGQVENAKIGAIEIIPVSANMLNQSTIPITTNSNQIQKLFRNDQAWPVR